MKCILLCAGYATRLFPLTENFPKALLKVGEKSILDYIVAEVNNIDQVDEIYLITNAKYTPHFEKWAEEKNNIKNIKVINDQTYSNDDRLGAIGDIMYTLDKEKIDDDVLIIAGDNLFTFDLRGFVKYFEEKKSPVICVKPEEDREQLKRFGIVELDENMKLTGFEEKPANPKSNYVSYAEYIYPRETLPLFKTYIEEGNLSDNSGEFVAFLHKRVDTYAYQFEGECYDIGTHDSLAQVNEIFS